MTDRRTLRVVPVACAVLIACSCTGFEATAYAGAMALDLSGAAALDQAAGGLNLIANRADIEDELGIDDTEYTPYLRAEFPFVIGSVTASAFGFSQTGTGTLAPTHQFGDIPGGSAVSTNLDFYNLKGAVHFDLINAGVLRVSPGLGLNAFVIDFRVDQVGTTNFESVDNIAPVPMLFVQGEVKASAVAATLDAGWMQADLGDAKGTYFDIEGLVRVRASENIEVFAGYRFIGLDTEGTADDRAFATNVELMGWTLGGGFVF